MVTKDAQFWLRITVVAIIALIVCMEPWVVVPFVLALFLSLLLRPLADVIMDLAARIGWRKFPIDVAILLSFAVFIMVMYLIMQSIFVPFINELQLFIAQLPTLTDQVIRMVQVFQDRWFDFIPTDVQLMIKDLLRRGANYMVEIAQTSVLLLLSVTGTLVELIVVPIIAFYMMKSGDRFKEVFVGLFPQEYRGHLDHVISEMHATLSAYIRGQLLMCALIAGLVFGGMWFFDVPYPLVIALLAGLMELIPIVGPIVGAIPAVLLAGTVSWMLAAKVLVFYIVVQQLEGHVIMPNTMGKVIDIHPVAIIGGVLLGSAVLGIFGMMLAVPVLAVVKVLARHMWYYNRYKKIGAE